MTIDIRDFAKLALEAFDAFLAPRGFQRASQNLDGNTFSADSLEWPERDWNSVALWRFRNFLERAERGAEYDLGRASNAQEVLEQALDDLVTFDGSFLEGDTKAFKQVRSAQNQRREPYTIHEPDGRGGYKARIDAVSKELKEKFHENERDNGRRCFSGSCPSCRISPPKSG